MNVRLRLEQGVLGGVLLFPNVFDGLQLDEGLFDDPLHVTIFRCIREFRERDVRPDVLLVANSVAPEVAARVFECQAEAPVTGESVGWYVQQLKAIWAKGRLGLLAGQVLLDSADAGKSVDELVGFVQGGLDGVVANQLPLEVTYAQSFMQEYLRVMGERVPFMPTCWGKLNLLVGGWRDSAFYVVAGRPGMGKTIVLLQAAYGLALEGKHVLYFSLEMPALQLQHRVLAQVCEIDYDRIANDDLDTPELNINNRDVRDLRRSVWAAEARLTDNLGFVCEAVLSPARLRAYVANASSRRKVDAVFIDYIGLMDDDVRHNSKTEKIGSISQQLKQIALTLDVPVVAAAQLNREIEARGEKAKPMLSDLRDSGSIEQDADVILMIQRKQTDQDRKLNPDGNGSEFYLVVAKNRHGRTGSVKFRAEDQYSRIVEV